MTISLFYKKIEVTKDLYLVEYLDSGKEIIKQFNGEFAYPEARIFAKNNSVNGYICYPLTRARQKVISGEVVKRGVKKKKTDFSDRPFSSSDLIPPNGMK